MSNESILDNIINALYEQSQMQNEGLHSLETSFDKINIYDELIEEKLSQPAQPVTVIDRLRDILEQYNNYNTRLRVLNERIGELIG